MASLQPGVLAKLLEHAGTGTKVAGEHRTTLLQVVGVVPRGDDPFLAGGACPGFLLRVSDSFHAAYVAVAGEDAELVAEDRVGVGQFVRVAGLDLVAGEAVPVLRGVSPLPRRRPCVGDPVDLVFSDSLRKSPPFAGAKKPPTSPGAKMSPHFVGAKKSTPFSEVKPRRRSMENGEVERKETRRLSLDLSSKKALDGRLKKTNVGKDESPSLKASSSSCSLFYMFDRFLCVVYCVLVLEFCSYYDI